MSYSSFNSLRIPILSQISGDEILPRTASAIDEIYQAAVLKNTRAMVVVGRPQSGKSELLRLTFDKLFSEQGRTLPIYYNLRRDCVKPEKFAEDFLLTALRHFLAFVGNDAELVVRYELSIHDLLFIAHPGEQPIIKEIIEGYESRTQQDDLRSLIRYVLGIPHRLASRSPYHLVVLLDESQWLGRVMADEEVATLFTEILQQPHSVSFILTGQQRSLLDQLAAEEGVIGTIKLLHFDNPEWTSLQLQTSRWCRDEVVKYDPEVGRMAVHQLDGNLFYLRSLVVAANERQMLFDKGADFERLYVAELLQGRVAHYFSRLLRTIANDATDGQAGELAAIEIVYICHDALTSRAPVDLIKAKISSRINTDKLLLHLHQNELITLLDGHILPSEDEVFCDWIRATYRRFEGDSLEVVRLDLLRRRIKSIAEILALSTRRSLHKQLEMLLLQFDQQSIGRSLMAHDEFVVRYGQAPYEIIMAGLEAETERIHLPAFVHIAEGSLFGTLTHTIAGNWSYLLAFGFEGGIYDQEHEIIWLLAVADSPTAISADAIDSLDEQLQDIQSALNLNSTADQQSARLVRWAISKLGFTPDGTEALAARGFASSDSLQLELFTKILEAAQKVEDKPAPLEDNQRSLLPFMETASEVSSDFFLETELLEVSTETEGARVLDPDDFQDIVDEIGNPDSAAVVGLSLAAETPKVESQPAPVPVASDDLELSIPINDDKEIIAARVAEKMAKEAGFSPEAVNQIKTALIEACLSLAAADSSADGKIYQRYHLDNEKLSITISNSEVGLDANAGELIVDDLNRIWRLDVLRSLMDSVRLRKLEGGWKIELTRLIPTNVVT